MRLAQETESDWWEVEALLDTCFGPGREALSSYRLREGVNPVASLCLTLRDDLDILAGAIRVWPVCIGPHPALLIGPVAVHPTRQGEGLGGLLIDGCLNRAKAWDRALLVGDAPYYARFGFRPLHDVKMPPPTNPERVLGFDLTAGAWQGISGNVLKMK